MPLILYSFFLIVRDIGSSHFLGVNWLNLTINEHKQIKIKLIITKLMY